MPDLHSQWTAAFARQARSDFAARDEILKASRLPQCHQLHLLQMAMEKLAKAHRMAQGVGPHLLQTSHAYIAKAIPQIVREQLHRSTGRHENWVIDAVRHLARRIELLAPAVDAGGTMPANSEYPWLAPSGDVVAPCDHDFGLGLVFERAGITMLKVLQARARELAQLPSDDSTD